MKRTACAGGAYGPNGAPGPLFAEATPAPAPEPAPEPAPTPTRWLSVIETERYPYVVGLTEEDRTLLADLYRPPGPVTLTRLGSWARDAKVVLVIRYDLPTID